MESNIRREVLFLVHQLLKDSQLHEGDFSDTVVSLERDIQESRVLGDVTVWNGTVKSLTLEDMQKKHERLPKNLLLAHLERLLQLSTSATTAIGGAPHSLLAIEDNSREDLAKQQRYRSASRQLVDTISQIGVKQTELKKLQARLEDIEVLLLNGDLPNEVVQVPPADVLKQMGQAREKGDLIKRIDGLQVHLSSLKIDVEDLIADLRAMGRLGAEAYRGICYNQIGWIQNRLTDITGVYKFHGSSNMGRIMSNSAELIRSKITTSYKFQYVTSGHYLCPAYCAVFDRSGRYAITGADDGLVKVWDVQHGRLVNTLRGHKGFITLIAVNPDNTLIASSCTLGDIRLWRLQDGECIAVLKHAASVNWIKFDELTGALASGGDDGYAIVWDLSKLLAATSGEFPILECALRARMSSASNTAGETVEAEATAGLMSPGAAALYTAPASGLFPWSVGAQSSGKLSLMHPQVNVSGDDSLAVVLCIDICPTGNIVVTGREDGIATVWKYGYMASEATRRDSPANAALQILSQLRNSEEVSRDEIITMETLVNHIICKLEGHVNAITDIKFNSKGDRLITGSLKEGTARVWSFSKNFNKFDHFVLSMSEEISENTTQSVNFRRFRAGRQKNQLFNVSWSNDDLFIYTLQSGELEGDTMSSKLKMWNSTTGGLLKVLIVSPDEANVLAIHPRTSYIVATAGSDGNVNVWNLKTDTKLMEYGVRCPPNIPNIDVHTPIKILDAAFSEDGMRLIVTDHIGRMLLFGLEDPDRYSAVNNEQYFSSDYNDFYMDEHGLAIDVGTNLPVHLVPNSYLCRMDGTSYGLISGTFNLDRETHVALTTEEVGRELRSKLELAAKTVESLDASYRSFKRAKNRYILTKESRVRDEPVKRLLAPRVHQISRTSSSHHHHQQLQSSSGARLFTTSSSTSRPTTRAVDLTDMQDVSDNSVVDPDWFSVRSSEEEPEQQLFRRSSRTSRRAVQQDEPHSRRSRRLSRNRVRVIRDESGDDSSSGSSSSESDQVSLGEQDAPPKRVRAANAPNRTRARPPRVRLPAAERVPMLPTSRWYTGKNFRHVPMDAVIYRDWATQEEPSDFQYCPQVGDSVVYFPQGHAEHLRFFHETAQPPWNNFPARWALVECRITSVRFDFPTQAEHKTCGSIIARVGLSISGIPMHIGGTSGTGHTLTDFSNPAIRRSSLENAEYSSFIVSVRKADGLPDFLIPSYLYRQAQFVRWRPGMRLSAPFLEAGEIKHYKGSIIGIASYDNNYPQSPWESLKVNWESDGDQQEPSFLGPWDAYLIEDETNTALTTALQQPKFLSPQLDLDVKKKAEAAVNACLESPAYAESFGYPVDLTLFPDYICVVPCPMHLDLIKARLDTNYYRQTQGLEQDVRLIQQNCAVYNQEGAPIIQLAAELVDTLIASFQPIPPLSTTITSISGGVVPQSSSLTTSHQQDIHQSENDVTARLKRKRPTDASEEDATTDVPVRNNGRRWRARFGGEEEKAAEAVESDEGSSQQQARKRGRPAALQVHAPVPAPAPVSAPAVVAPLAAVATTTRSGRAVRAVSRMEDDSSPGEEEKETVGRRPARATRESVGVSLGRRARRATAVHISRRGISQQQQHSASSGDSDSEDSASERSSSEGEGRAAVMSASKSRGEGGERRPQRGRARPVVHGDVDNIDEEEEEEETDAVAVTVTAAATRSGRRVKPRDDYVPEIKRTSRISAAASSYREVDSDVDEKLAEAPRPSSRHANRGRRPPEPQLSEVKVAPRQSPEAKVGRCLDPDLKRQLQELLALMEGQDTDGIFADPVTEDIAPGYLEMIPCPMDFSTIRSKLSHRLYASVADMVVDLQTMYGNCMLYNDDESSLYQKAEQDNAFLSTYLLGKDT